jgi:hypothetical protein
LRQVGIAAAERDSNRIREAGKSPVLVILISGLTAVITTVGADLPRLH